MNEISSGAYAVNPENLAQHIRGVLDKQARAVTVGCGEVTVEVTPENYVSVMRRLRDADGCRFEQLIDLCGIDMSTYADVGATPRFCVAVQLLSVSLNQRVRVKVFCADDDMPQLDTVTDLWRSADWFEREAFDLFGIVFLGHGDLRRILTDYGFIGHPLRKDFPLSGTVEMKYDEKRQRVVYQPVSIEARELTPRIVREESFGGLAH